MKIKTSKGKTLEVNWMFGPTQTTGDIMIQTTDDRPLSEIAADFEGCEKIEKVDNGRAGVTEMYEGFTQLTGIRKNAQTWAIHITLARG